MRFDLRCTICVTVLTAIPLLASTSRVSAQESFPSSPASESAQLPDAPSPQVEVASAAEPAAEAQDSSSAPSPTPAPDAKKEQYKKAEEQIKEQEKQRLVGIVPQFNISYRADAVSMTAGQKMKLALRSTTDPVSFGAAFVVAGYHEAMDDDKGFGWGWEGYGKRSGAAYLDAFDGTIIGNGILPSILHQDPRYFRLGYGTVTHRMLYSLATNVISKHDNPHKWEPNYSNIGGNLIAGAISNLYYPAGNSGIGQTFTNGLIVTAEGGFGSIFDEFWPDISRKILHKDPTHGLDAQARAADKARKEAEKARKEAEKQAETGRKDGSAPAK